tara:strand:- start:993 stop:1286 length:294 start_codon:yes stop_codon:yes gene_type:complete
VINKMSMIDKTEYEWKRENQITNEFSKEEVKLLERIAALDKPNPMSQSNFPWGCSNSLKRFLIEQEERMKKVWIKTQEEIRLKRKKITKDIIYIGDA